MPEMEMLHEFGNTDENVSSERRQEGMCAKCRKPNSTVVSHSRNNSSDKKCFRIVKDMKFIVHPLKKFPLL